MEGPAIGIDLGTTYSCVSVYYNGKVHIIPNLEQGADPITPSYVFLDTDGDEVVGHPAKSNAFRNLDNTIYDVKRILGREFKNPELQHDMKFWPFTVQQGDDDTPMIEVNGERFYPEEISAKILQKLKSFAEMFLQLKPGAIKKAVITVPAYFHDGQRQATIDAGELAGLEVLTILNEPTAAAIAYSMERLDTNPQKILVYDLGGGTFDVAGLNMGADKIEVLGVSGDTHLGGQDFDKQLMEYCLSQFKLENGVDLIELKDSTDSVVKKKAKRSIRRLQTYCETLKKDLTSGVKATISVDAFHDGEDLVVKVTRPQFEEMNRTYFEKTIELVDTTLKELQLTKSDIDDIVLVGGSTRIPMVQKLLRDYFDGKVLNSSIHPDQAVAYGAAVQAALMTGNKLIGMERFDKIQDVTPMSLGVENASKSLSVTIPKNSKIPIRMSRHYVTSRGNFSKGNVKVYQGNDLTLAANNRLLGTFLVQGIAQNEPGQDHEEIDITMEVNDMGILHVEAVCKSSKMKSTLTVVENKNRMKPETKQRLLAKINPQEEPTTLLNKLQLLWKGGKT